ncbi:hypothetical protein GW17_00044740 [Ensete ventricosum]|nr:hypothetical protein GW17_00044740 [Ensete ventricosum]
MNEVCCWRQRGQRESMSRQVRNKSFSWEETAAAESQMSGCLPTRKKCIVLPKQCPSLNSFRPQVELRPECRRLSRWRCGEDDGLLNGVGPASPGFPPAPCEKRQEESPAHGMRSIILPWLPALATTTSVDLAACCYYQRRPCCDRCPCFLFLNRDQLHRSPSQSLSPLLNRNRNSKGSPPTATLNLLCLELPCLSSAFSIVKDVKGSSSSLELISCNPCPLPLLHLSLPLLPLHPLLHASPSSLLLLSRCFPLPNCVDGACCRQQLFSSPAATATYCCSRFQPTFFTHHHSPSPPSLSEASLPLLHLKQVQRLVQSWWLQSPSLSTSILLPPLVHRRRYFCQLERGILPYPSLASSSSSANCSFLSLFLPLHPFPKASVFSPAPKISTANSDLLPIYYDQQHRRRRTPLPLEPAATSYVTVATHVATGCALAC